jgi:hypothetical protein
VLIAAAVCPHPPLLAPEATGAPGPDDAQLGRLRTACQRAIAALVAQQPDLIVVVGGAAHTAEYPPDATGSLREFGIPFAVSGESQTSETMTGPWPEPVLPLPLTIGKWLLAEAETNGPGAPADGGDGPVPVAWRAIAADAPPAECLELGAAIAALAPRVAMLAMGDGPGCRARGAPGAEDPAADRYDEQVTAALAAADPGALAALDPGQDGRLFIAGRAAWQVLAGAADPGAFDAELSYAAAPFEVSYYVATWGRKGKVTKRRG